MTNGGGKKRKKKSLIEGRKEVIKEKKIVEKHE